MPPSQMGEGRGQAAASPDHPAQSPMGASHVQALSSPLGGSNDRQTDNNKEQTRWWEVLLNALL